MVGELFKSEVELTDTVLKAIDALVARHPLSKHILPLVPAGSKSVPYGDSNPEESVYDVALRLAGYKTDFPKELPRHTDMQKLLYTKGTATKKGPLAIHFSDHNADNEWRICGAGLYLGNLKQQGHLFLLSDGAFTSERTNIGYHVAPQWPLSVESWALLATKAK